MRPALAGATAARAGQGRALRKRGRGVGKRGRSAGQEPDDRSPPVVPPAPPLSKAGAIQLNDVFVDERQIVYTVDRLVGGLYILEMDF